MEQGVLPQRGRLSMEAATEVALLVRPQCRHTTGLQNGTLGTGPNGMLVGPHPLRASNAHGRDADPGPGEAVPGAVLSLVPLGLLQRDGGS
eukprot:5044331-Amphidinium_carterae.1